MTSEKQTAYIRNPQQNAKNLDGDKERTGTYQVVAIETDEEGAQRIITVAELRLWMGRSRSASKVYASFWLHRPGWAGGHGSAAGYGYHKPSAAANEAIRSAGIYLTHPIDGYGERAIEEALLAVAATAGYPTAQII